jgi:hypothetical protein
VATAASVTGETDTADNTKTSQIDVQAEVIDVSVTAIAAPDSAVQGETVSVQVTVKNVGNRDVSSFAVALADLTDAAGIGSQIISGLTPGEEQTLTFTWDTTAASLGDHTLQASHDLSDDDAGNNSLTDTVTIFEPGQDQVVMYFSLQYDGSVNGLTVQNEDIVAFDGSTFSLYFNGTPYLSGPFGGFTIDAFTFLSDTEILLSFAEDGYIVNDDGSQLYADDCDVIKFSAYSPDDLGANTAGRFTMYFDGSDVGLTASSEDIDGLSYVVEGGVGRLLISTNGAFGVIGATGNGEDVLRFTPTSLGANTAGSWSMYFDGSDVGLAGTNESVDGLALFEAELYLSTAGNFAVPGVAGGDEDVFVFTPTSLGANTAGSYDPTLFFDASGSNDIWGLDVRLVPAGGGTAANLTAPTGDAADGGGSKISRSTPRQSPHPLMESASLADDMTPRHRSRPRREASDSIPLDLLRAKDEAARPAAPNKLARAAADAANSQATTSRAPTQTDSAVQWLFAEADPLDFFWRTPS